MSQTVSWSCAHEFPSDPVSAVNARDFVRQHLIEHDLLFLVDDLRLVTSELATNALLHAGQPFLVTLQADTSWLVLSVHDHSPQAPAQLAAQVMDTTGRGLSIVDNLSHHWGVDGSTGWSKSVWASFDLTGPNPRQSGTRDRDKATQSPHRSLDVTCAHGRG
jgi:anti-sigma regulatory factor (Ser/Thr protein kinase)